MRTLKIMLHVYVRELKENHQLDSGRLDCLFPRLENLLELHTHFLSCLKERRRENLVSSTDRNYTINRVADILITQVGDSCNTSVMYTHALKCSASQYGTQVIMHMSHGALWASMQTQTVITQL